MNICFIGYGNMANAIALGLKDAQDITIHACSPSLTEAQTADGIYTHPDNNAVIDSMDVVMLCVKPHQIPTVLPSLKLNPETLLISVAAGVTIEQLEKYAPVGQPIVRTMPNTPIAVGYGATQLIQNQYCTSKHRTLAEAIFANSGIYLWVDSESMLDTYTGLSGSGPAYVFYILEGLIEGAMQMGVDAENAKLFAQQTILGAIKLCQNSPLEPAELRRNVTSPGGATAEAIKVFDKHQLKQIIAEAMQASTTQAGKLKESAK